MLWLAAAPPRIPCSRSTACSICSRSSPGGDGSVERGAAAMPAGGLLVRVAHPQDRGLGEGPADDLEGQRQADAGKSARHAQRRQPQPVERAREARETALPERELLDGALGRVAER